METARGSAPGKVQGRCPHGGRGDGAADGGREIGAGMVADSGFHLADAKNGEVPGYAVFDAVLACLLRQNEVRPNP